MPVLAVKLASVSFCRSIICGLLTISTLMVLPSVFGLRVGSPPPPVPPPEVGAEDEPEPEPPDEATEPADEDAVSDPDAVAEPEPVSADDEDDEDDSEEDEDEAEDDELPPELSLDPHAAVTVSRTAQPAAATTCGAFFHLMDAASFRWGPRPGGRGGRTAGAGPGRGWDLRARSGPGGRPDRAGAVGRRWPGDRAAPGQRRRAPGGLTRGPPAVRVRCTGAPRGRTVRCR
ncbi:hypothetical protein GCM10011594_24560 [Nakamurella endophytica]|uniref:Uncharacterized protein n=1 Tax=Nakamurella endophytica TaxID=1748367 RepID=A0A917SXF8_9ACTN|nr:hypothetical protein GCM10011594_24560 [Nakamurella endophytica]